MKTFNIKIIFLLFLFVSVIFADNEKKQEKKLAYIVSDIEIPFWKIMSKGILEKSKQLGYSLEIYSSNNLRKDEIKHFSTALDEKVDGIILSPIHSSSTKFLLKLSKKENIPVVISDIGSDSDDYISFISSNNFEGAYKIGKVLTKKLKDLNWQDGSVGIVAIPQKRENGKLRTKGFLKALDEDGIKSAGLEQQVDFSHKETYEFSKKLIENNPDLKALWLQGSNRYQGALDAINDTGKKGKILLVCFDSEPEFLEMIPNGKLVGAAMQQPFLMGAKAVEQMDNYLNGKDIEKNIQLEILAISQENIKSEMQIIRKNVLGLE